MTAAGRRPPQDDQELMRDFDHRLAELEHPTATRVGKWVLATGPGDDLVASFVGGGSVVLSPPPKVGDSPDDTQTDEALPELVLTATAGQTIGSSADTIVSWDNLVYQVGEWALGASPVEDITIPADGLWQITFEPQWNTSSASWANHQINIDGVAVALERQYPGGNIPRSGVLTVPRRLEAGQVVRAVVRTGSGSHTLGVSGWNTNVVTRLSLICLRRAEATDSDPDAQQEG